MDMDLLKDQIYAIAAAGARPHHKKFALTSVKLVRQELLDAVDGAEETKGRDAWLSGLIAHLDSAISQIEAIR